ncbi:hypothetical protein NEFER03_0593 [Nematocida sp. LUAm3]|nr:hypothetical protein NEFER03_0593 [Nematocida sp. LUAm3]KAI5175560.1 hypothetical protein NEFER02_1466 [Nematocida sp. LUAm2]KAI5178410.1 hypothetical protein NEFER01_1557 [Nematocida sp. LUAm1]
MDNPLGPLERMHSAEELSISTVEELSSSENINESQEERILEILGKCPLRRCLFSSLDSPLILYSNALFCLTQHSAPLNIRKYRNICIFEKKVLKALWKADKVSFHSYMDMYCEQEIDSLGYLVFNRAVKEDSSVLEDVDIVYLVLDLLYTRREYERFYRVYSIIKKESLRTLQLGMLVSLMLPEKDPIWMLQRIRKYLGVSSSSKEEWMDSSSDAEASSFERMLKEEVDPKEASPQRKLEIYFVIRKWFNQKYIENLWRVSMEKWRECKETEGSSEAMIDLCVKMKKYEEAWRIYKVSIEMHPSTLRKLHLSQRIIRLLICAINSDGVNNWMERLLEASSVVSHLEIERDSLVKSMISPIFSVEKYEVVTYIISSILHQIPTCFIDSKIFQIISGNLLQIIEKHNEKILQETKKEKKSDLIVSTLEIYCIWKKNTQRGIFSTMIFGRSEECLNIFYNMLYILSILRVKPFILLVCTDIWESGISVTHSISDALIEVHNLLNCPCNEFPPHEETETRNYLRHIISVLQAHG